MGTRIPTLRNISNETRGNKVIFVIKNDRRNLVKISDDSPDVEQKKREDFLPQADFDNIKEWASENPERQAVIRFGYANVVVTGGSTRDGVVIDIDRENAKLGEIHGGVRTKMGVPRGGI
jgi:hypothetical protein